MGKKSKGSKSKGSPKIQYNNGSASAVQQMNRSASGGLPYPITNDLDRIAAQQQQYPRVQPETNGNEQKSQQVQQLQQQVQQLQQQLQQLQQQPQQQPQLLQQQSPPPPAQMNYAQNNVPQYIPAESHQQILPGQNSGPSGSSLRSSSFCDGHELKVWLGFIKLDGKIPNREALQHLLYPPHAGVSSPVHGADHSGSAADADVIALFLTDLDLSPELLAKRAGEVKFLLKESLVAKEDYIVNEDDDALLVEHIPAQLIQANNGVARYNSLHVAVHRRNVADRAVDGTAGDNRLDHDDCFPMPVSLQCRTSRKNESAAAFKSIMFQEVMLRRGAEDLQLILLGANLDTDDEAKHGQLADLDRLIRHVSQGHQKSCSLLWGDFNNRLCAFQELEKDLVLYKNKVGKHVLSDANIQTLVNMILDDRRGLLAKDSVIYTGMGLDGKRCAPAACNNLLHEMFILGLDAGPELTIPLPSYKQTPHDNVLSEEIGKVLTLKNLEVDASHCGFGRGNCQHSREQQEAMIKKKYFGWHENGKYLQRQVRGDGQNDYLQLGWLDGIGVYRNHSGLTSARLAVWQTSPCIQAFDHLPLRAVVAIEVGQA